MATLNSSILLAQHPVKMPSLDMSNTFVEMARIKALQQQQRLEELQYGQLERSAQRDAAFDQLAANLFTESQPASPPPRGLAGGPSPTGGPPPPAPMGQGPGPWASGYVTPPGGTAPGIPQPTSMEEGTFTMAQGGPQPQLDMPPQMRDGSPQAAAPMRGLAAEPLRKPAPPPPSPSAGLGGAQPGAPKSLLQPLNEDVLMRLYAANPEKASKLMEGHLKMQEQKLSTAEKMNDQIRQTLAAVERSPNPAAMYPEAITSLKERGIPIPASFPMEYNPALVRFKIMEHETLKNQLDQAKIENEKQHALQRQAEAGLAQAKTGAVPSEIEANKALTGHRGAETALARAKTGMVPMQADAERALAEQRRAQAALDKARQTGIPADIEAAQAQVRLRDAEAGLAKARASGIPADIQAAQALATLRQAETGLAEARTKGVPAEIKAAEALVEKHKAEAARIPLQGQEDVARTKKLEEETTNLVNERKAKLAQVTPYTTDSKKNIYLSQAAQELTLPPGTPPTKDVIERARQYEVADEQAVVRKTGLDAALRNLPEAEGKRIQAMSDKGTAMEGLQNTLDEVERLIGEGVYTNIPEERLNHILADVGLRANDPIAARTARLYELGNALALESAGGKLGGQVSDTDLKVIQSAGGNLQRPKSALSMQESIKSMRTLAKIHLTDANSGWKKYKETGSLPKFGEARAERLKILTPEMLDDAYEARKKDGWSKEQLREGFLKQGYREE